METIHRPGLKEGQPFPPTRRTASVSGAAAAAAAAEAAGPEVSPDTDRTELELRISMFWHIRWRLDCRKKLVIYDAYKIIRPQGKTKARVVKNSLSPFPYTYCSHNIFLCCSMDVYFILNPLYTIDFIYTTFNCIIVNVQYNNCIKRF